MHLSNALGAKEEIIGGVTLNNTNESPGSVTSRAIYTLDRKERMINITDRDDTETTCTQ